MKRSGIEGLTWLIQFRGLIGFLVWVGLSPGWSSFFGSPVARANAGDRAVASAQKSAQGLASHMEQVQKVAGWLEGVMDTTTPPSASGKSVNVRMRTCRIRLADDRDRRFADSIFLYQEQAVRETLEQPYRQRFLQIMPTADGSIESKAYKPEKPTAFVNWCDRQPDTMRVLPTVNLGTPICSVFLRVEGDRFIGETPPQGCPTSVRGAVRMTNTIELFADGMNTWDRGFDANGKQLWGAKNESYQYRRSQ
jgi:CpeT/CpcT family (DUF1001)